MNGNELNKMRHCGDVAPVEDRLFFSCRNGHKVEWWLTVASVPQLSQDEKAKMDMHAFVATYTSLDSDNADLPAKPRLTTLRQYLSQAHASAP